eukprot:2812905-Lingulodinium_polyedra.AAC.1
MNGIGEAASFGELQLLAEKPVGAVPCAAAIRPIRGHGSEQSRTWDRAHRLAPGEGQSDRPVALSRARRDAQPLLQALSYESGHGWALPSPQNWGI